MTNTPETTSRDASKQLEQSIRASTEAMIAEFREERENEAARQSSNTIQKMASGRASDLPIKETLALFSSTGEAPKRFTAYDVSMALTLTHQIKLHAARGDILSVPMPNGKTLAECTGEEVGEIGAWLTAISKEFGRTEGR